jgi:hypothetical protein
MNFPYATLPNLLGSPHNSPMVAGVIGRATELAAANIRGFLNRETVRGILRREEYE